MTLKQRLSTLSLALLCIAPGYSFAETLNADKVNKQQGAPLPYQVLRNDIADNAKSGNMLEIRNGGYGSDMTAHPTNRNQFYALTDRGPNATYKTGQYGKEKSSRHRITPHVLACLK